MSVAQIFIRKFIVRFGIGAIFAAIIMGGLFVVYQQDVAKRETLKKEAVSIAGTKNIELCATPAKRANGSVPDAPKVVVLDMASNFVAHQYHDLLAPGIRSTSSTETNVVMCVQSITDEFDTEEYGSGSVASYYCRRYTSDVAAYLVDVATGKTIAYRLIAGGEPPECPERTDKSLSKYGEGPNSDDVMKWLNQKIQQ